MENVTKLLMSQLGENGLETLAGKSGGDKTKVSQALEGAVPSLLNAISGNTKSVAGADSFLMALEKDHDGSILNDMGGYLKEPQKANGAGILKHVLGDKRKEVETNLAARSGLSVDNTGGLLETVAPLIMGFLGKQKKQAGGALNASNISGILSSLGSGKGFDLSSLAGMAEVGNSSSAKGMMDKVSGLMGKH